MNKITFLISLGLAAIIIAFLTQIIVKENSNENLTTAIILPYFPKGEQGYDSSLFIPEVNQAVTVDRITFIYTGNSTGNQCKGGPFVNQTELKNFVVTMQDGFVIKKDVCWPPPMWYGPPPNVFNRTIGTPPLRYAISWFDTNYTSAVAYCDSNICPYGSSIYLARKQ